MKSKIKNISADAPADSVSLEDVALENVALENVALEKAADKAKPSPDTARLLRQMPSVTRLLAQPAVQDIAGVVSPALLTISARVVLEQARRALLAAIPVPDTKRNGGANPAASAADPAANVLPDDAELAELAALVAREALRRHAPTLAHAVNATGIVLHTGLGRARLADAARDALVNVASGHAIVEIERETGRRGSRRDHVRGLLCELTGAEDAAVVNNCAGAVFLAVNALAAGREVIISRGELVEIGGAFRMPDIIRASGATLVEVGTTNRTRTSDYEAAITERTGLILRCSPSNFALIGFTEAAPTSELAALGRARNIPVLDDQGSGALLGPDILGLADSLPTMKGTLRDSVRAGSDLIMASGDKLLGGPQAGLLLGRKEIIDCIVAHPLARALRVDKFTLAALEATLRLYRDPEQAMQAIPTLRYLRRTEPEIRRMAQKLRAKLRAILPDDLFTIDLVSERSQVGGGSLPGEDLPTVCVRLRLARNVAGGANVVKGAANMPGGMDVDGIARLLRLHTPAVFARIKEGAILFDPRTLEPDEITHIVEAARSLLS